MKENRMRKVTEYELLRKAQYLAQHLHELSMEFPFDDEEELGQQISVLSASIPAALVQAENGISGCRYSVGQILKAIEYLAKLLLLARDREYLVFYQWNKWTEELNMFRQMLTAMEKSYSYRAEPFSLTFTTELYLR